MQPVSAETLGCHGACSKLSNADGNYFINKTPGTVMVNKAYGDLTVECSKDGEKSKHFIKSLANASMVGNIIFGAAIDGGSGEGYDYPTSIQNGLICKSK